MFQVYDSLLEVSDEVFTLNASSYYQIFNVLFRLIQYPSAVILCAVSVRIGRHASTRCALHLIFLELHMLDTHVHLGSEVRVDRRVIHDL
jgi:hypothetical protein